MADFASESGMDLLLWRHAEAEDGVSDMQRQLTARGEKQAEQVAQWLKIHAPKQMNIVASPAKRTRQTAEALDLPFSTDPRLSPEGSVSGILAAIGWPEGKGVRGEAVLVVGHQPALGRLASLLLAGQEAEWTIKKGAVWWFTNRVRQGETQTVLRAVIPPDLVR